MRDERSRDLSSPLAAMNRNVLKRTSRNINDECTSGKLDTAALGVEQVADCWVCAQARSMPRFVTAAAIAAVSAATLTQTARPLHCEEEQQAASTRRKVSRAFAP